MSAIVKLAETLDMTANINPISLGQGQGPKAIAGINEGSKTGKWVLLQNCHLGVSFMPTLETMVEKLNPDECHEMFRLWLTACPSPAFPISILQNGVKMTIEPPKGLKQALMGAYLSMDEEWFESCRKPGPFKKMLYGLCFFHGVILERRGFGPVGWNNAYGFSEPDRDISMKQLQHFLNEFEGVPFDALNYMVAEANYGGRVTDNQDRRAILCILSDYYSPEILKDGYKFSVSGTYTAPPEGDLASYLDFIRELPINTTPEVFWLHNNANLTAAINEGMGILKTAVTLMSSFGGGGASADDDEDVGKAKTREEIFADSASEFLAILPEQADLGAVARKYPVRYDQCLNTVLHMELGKFNKLLGKVKDTLNNLIKAVKGLVVFSPELEEVGEGCLTNKVPGAWKSVSYPSLKPLGSYVLDHLERWKFMNSWVQDGIPPSFWFSVFFFQQAYLTAVLQNFARGNTIAIDRCTWDFKHQRADFEPEEPPERGSYIYGLFLSGARWDDENGVMADSLPKVLWSVMPMIQLLPTEISKSTIDKTKMYGVPTYKTSERKGVLSTSGHSSNFIMYMYVNHAPEHAGVVTDATQDRHNIFWTRRGVAFISQTDD